MPPSKFLRALIDEDASVANGPDAEANLCRLIQLTRDDTVANRDWATLLLAQQEIDTPEVREALLTAADDANEYVRGEAILGLAERDKGLALPLLQRELKRDFVTLQLLEAASVVAHPSLTEDLRNFTDPSGDDFLDELAVDALRACEAAV